MAVLNYLPTLKRGQGIAFGAHFLHDFFHKSVPWSEKVSMPYLFSFSRYQTKCIIKFLFKQWLFHQMYTAFKEIKPKIFWVRAQTLYAYRESLLKTYIFWFIL